MIDGLKLVFHRFVDPVTMGARARVTADFSTVRLSELLESRMLEAIVSKVAERYVEEEYSSIVKQVKKHDVIKEVSAQVTKKVVERLYR